MSDVFWDAVLDLICLALDRFLPQISAGQVENKRLESLHAKIQILWDVRKFFDSKFILKPASKMKSSGRNVS